MTGVPSEPPPLLTEDQFGAVCDFILAWAETSVPRGRCPRRALDTLFRLDDHESWAS